MYFEYIAQYLHRFSTNFVVSFLSLLYIPESIENVFKVLDLFDIGHF